MTIRAGTINKMRTHGYRHLKHFKLVDAGIRLLSTDLIKTYFIIVLEDLFVGQQHISAGATMAFQCLIQGHCNMWPGERKKHKL